MRVLSLAPSVWKPLRKLMKDDVFLQDGTTTSGTYVSMEYWSPGLVIVAIAASQDSVNRKIVSLPANWTYI